MDCEPICDRSSPASRCGYSVEHEVYTQVTDTIRILAEWLDANRLVGYDPYDIKGHPAFAALQSNSVLRKAGNVVLEMFPHSIRKLFGVGPTTNAKGLGLVMDAYVWLFRGSGDDRYLDLARNVATRLLGLRSPGYDFHCWGYPFDWQAKGCFTPAGTPSSVVTSTVAMSFEHLFEITGDSDYADVAESSAMFMINCLNVLQHEHGKCVSYTPIDRKWVHNANLFSAALLAVVGRRADIPYMCESALDMARFTVSFQRSDGSWPYGELLEKCEYEPRVFAHTDNYHTGFVLRALASIYRLLQPEWVLDALVRGMEFYVNSLITEGGVPKRNSSSLYPIDIHACSESVLCLVDTDDLCGHGELATPILLWTLDNMKDKRTGLFFYRRYRGWTSKMPYLRWGQAWMLLALARYATYHDVYSLDTHHGSVSQ